MIDYNKGTSKVCTWCVCVCVNIRTSTKTKADDLNSLDSVQCIYEAKPKHNVQCLSPIVSTAHVTSFIF